MAKSQVNILIHTAGLRGIEIPKAPVLKMPGRVFDGTVCDIIGFSQHASECQSDSIFEILMFTDGMKEVSQPYLYNIPEEDLMAKSFAVTRPGNYEAFRMFLLMKFRFANMYDRIKRLSEIRPHRNAKEARKNEYELRKNEESFKLARYCSLESGVEIKRIIKGESVESVSWGIHTMTLVAATKIMLQFFNLDALFSIANGNLEHYSDHIVAFKISSRSGDAALANHSTSLFVCGGKWMYYDNEVGLTEFDKDEFIRYATSGELRSIIKGHTLCMARAGVAGSITHVWSKAADETWGWSNKEKDLSNFCIKFGDVWLAHGHTSRDFAIEFFFVPKPIFDSHSLNIELENNHSGGKRRTCKRKRRNYRKRTRRCV